MSEVSHALRRRASFPLHDHEIASKLLLCHHVSGQLAVATGFLDALGVLHDEGLVDSFENIDANDDVVRSAVTRLVTDYGPRHPVPPLPWTPDGLLSYCPGKSGAL